MVTEACNGCFFPNDSWTPCSGSHRPRRPIARGRSFFFARVRGCRCPARPNVHPRQRNGSHAPHAPHALRSRMSLQLRHLLPEPVEQGAIWPRGRERRRHRWWARWLETLVNTVLFFRFKTKDKTRRGKRFQCYEVNYSKNGNA